MEEEILRKSVRCREDENFKVEESKETILQIFKNHGLKENDILTKDNSWFLYDFSS